MATHRDALCAMAVSEEELVVQVVDATDVSDLNSREYRQLQQLTEQWAREMVVCALQCCRSC